MLDLIYEIDVRFDDGSVKKRVVFTQPGMRYSLSKALVHSLLDDPTFNELSEKAKNIIIEKILEDVKGRMLEDIVLLDATKSTNYKKVFKFLFLQGGEMDMVCYDTNEDSCALFEIKHSKAMVMEQARYLLDERMNDLISARFGKIISRIVLYRGPSEQKGGVSYQNVESYLKGL